MSLIDVDAVYKSIEQLWADGVAVSKQIMLFGGEPLQRVNKDLVSYLVNQGLQRGFRFSAITNGHDLNGFIELLGKDKIDAIQITLDGPKTIHDRRRRSLDGTSSFDRIISNIRQAVQESDVQITVRVNIDEENYPEFKELLEVFRHEGWLGHNKIAVNAAIVYQKDVCGAAYPLQDPTKIRAELLDEAKEYSNIAVGCPQANQGEMVFSALFSGKPYILHSAYCGASSGTYIFLPGGKVSCCLESIGEKSSYIGNYSTDGLVLNEDIVRRRFGRSATKIPECADCKYCLVCAGGCSLYAESNLGDIYKPYCGDFPQTYPWVLADAVENFLRANGL
jgi:uncharacterized protein